MKKVLLLGAIFLAACSQKPDSQISSQNIKESSQLVSLKNSEILEDFQQQVQLFKKYYGPYQYKQDRFGYNIDTIAQDLSTKIMTAQTEEEGIGYLYQFGALMKDGHVQIRHSLSASGIANYSLGFGITPVEDTALVASINPDRLKDTRIKVGDELLLLDGKKPSDYIPTILKYRSLATEESNKHILYSLTSRPSYMTDLKPTQVTAIAVFKNAKGETYQVEIPWMTKKYNPANNHFIEKPNNHFAVQFAEEFNQAYDNSIFEMGNTKPFFASEAVKNKYSFIEVYASEEARIAAGLKKEEKPPVYSALYRYNGKTILLVRSFSYSPDDYSVEVYLKYFKAIMKEYEPLADVLIMDQTHNPGGNGWYCSSLASMLLKEKNDAPVQMCRADRKWIDSMLNVTDPENKYPNDLRLNIAMGRAVEKAYDDGKLLSEPIAIFTDSLKLAPFGDYKWKKPRLVLIDELAGSCGDVFPMILRDNNASKFFGKRTMGLGGNVEQVGVLNNSQVKISMTRGLFMTNKEDGKYQESDYIENNGVQPDYPYSHTVQDFRNGFVNYVEEFSKKAVEQIEK